MTPPVPPTTAPKGSPNVGKDKVTSNMVSNNNNLPKTAASTAITPQVQGPNQASQGGSLTSAMQRATISEQKENATCSSSALPANTPPVPVPTVVSPAQAEGTTGVRPSHPSAPVSCKAQAGLRDSDGGGSPPMPPPTGGPFFVPASTLPRGSGDAATSPRGPTLITAERLDKGKGAPAEEEDFLEEDGMDTGPLLKEDIEALLRDGDLGDDLLNDLLAFRARHLTGVLRAHSGDQPNSSASAPGSGGEAPSSTSSRKRPISPTQRLVDHGWKIKKPARDFTWLADTIISTANAFGPEANNITAEVMATEEDGLRGYALCLSGVPAHLLDYTALERQLIRILPVVPLHTAIIPEANRVIILLACIEDWDKAVELEWDFGRLDHPPGYIPTLEDHLFYYRIMFHLFAPHGGDFRKDLAAACAEIGIALLSIANTKNSHFIMGYARVLADLIAALRYVANGSKLVVSGKENAMTVVTIRKSLCSTNDPRVVKLQITNFPVNIRDDALLAKIRHGVSKFKLGNPNDVVDAHVYLAYKTNRRTKLAYAWVVNAVLAEKLCAPGKVIIGVNKLRIIVAPDDGGFGGSNNNNSAEDAG